MSMKIGENYSDCSTGYLDKVQSNQEPELSQKNNDTYRRQNAVRKEVAKTLLMFII